MGGVVKLNDWHKHRIPELIVKNFWYSHCKKIIILGFSFKANTNDTRESSAISICKDLLEEGAILKIHDPKVTKTQIERDLGISEKIIPDKIDYQKRTYFEGSWSYIYEFNNSFEDADAVVVLTVARIRRN